ncbi:hypothetical protein UT300007_07230 [Clostridium sp. CTA-7]|jgi:hypothetical protein
MEIIFEFLFTILIEGCFEVISSQKVNIVIRKIILGIITLFYVCLSILFIILLVKVNSIVAKMILGLAITLILSILIKLWVKLYKNKVF